MMIVDPYRFGAQSPAGIAYDAAYTASNVGSVSTATGVNFGSVSSGRVIIVAVHCNTVNATGIISSATIGGVAASVIVEGVALSSGPPRTLAIIAAYVPTGTSGTIVVNFTSSSIASFFVYLASNIQSLTPIGVGAAASASSPVGTTCNVKADGIVVSAAITFPVSAPMNLSGVTKNYETSPSSGFGNYAGGCALTPSTVTAASFQESDAGGTGGAPIRTLAVASFR